jgi:hypothetical protein
MRIYKNIPDHFVLDCSTPEQKDIKLRLQKKILENPQWNSVSDHVWEILAKELGMKYQGKVDKRLRPVKPKKLRND